MDSSQEQLSDLARRSADAVGFGPVSAIEVVPSLNMSDEETLVFSFLVDWDRDFARDALPRVRLAQRLRDALLDRQDARYPTIRVFTERDWERRERAGFS